jgi:hypothetical protein
MVKKMSIFARVANGSVAELFTPPIGSTIGQCFNAGLIWVDCTSTPGVAQGWTYAAGVFTAPAATPSPTPVQLAAIAYAAFIAGGIAITSTGTPALNGTYGIDPASCANVAMEAQFITAFALFTTGNTNALPWQLQSGAIVTFTATAAFMALAKAIGMSVAAAKVAAMQGQVMPAASASIP